MSLFDLIMIGISLSMDAFAVSICKGDSSIILWQYRIILSADTASEVRQMLSQKRR